VVRGLDAGALRQGLERLVADPEVRAVVAFGSRARGDGRADSDLDLAVISTLSKLEPASKRAAWNRHTSSLGRVGVGVDLIVNGWQDAAYLAQSRWHVMGDEPAKGRCSMSPAEDALLLQSASGEQGGSRAPAG
jgi:predicted nucleotidyltransferase